MSKGIMLNDFWSKVYIKFFGKKIKPRKEIHPIIKCQPFRTGMNENQIKHRLVMGMVEELMQYVEFTMDEQENVKILTARLDVIKKGM